MADDAAGGPGSRLKAAREGMEVTAREVAEALNLPVRVIEALESNDYDRLPPTVFTRGYLRSYARLLELPAEELVALYPAVETEPEPSPAVPEHSAFTVDARVIRLAGLGIGVVVLVVLLAVWLLGGEDESGQPALVDDQSSQVQPADQASVSAPQDPGTEVRDTPVEMDPTSPVGADQGSAEAPVVPEAGVPEVGGPVAGGPAPGRPEPRDPYAAAPGESAQPSTPVQPLPSSIGATGGGDRMERRISEFGDDRLTFHFERECWIEVKSITGETLYSNLNPAGRRLDLLGEAPFQVKVGFAPGVTLHFNGEPVALTGHTRNNVANLTLGQ